MAKQAMVQLLILEENHIQRQLYLISDGLLALFACDDF